MLAHAVRINGQRADGALWRIAAAGRNEHKTRGPCACACERTRPYARARTLTPAAHRHADQHTHTRARAAAIRKHLTAAEAANVAFVYADVIDQGSLLAMCSRTRVLINCVGPVRRRRPRPRARSAVAHARR